MNNSHFSFTVEKSESLHSIITLSYAPSDSLHKPMSIKIAPELGSNLFSWIYDGHEIIYTEQEVLEQAGFTGTYVLFPTPNRVKDFTYTWNNKQYILKKNGKKVDIHHQLVYDQKWTHTTPEIHGEYVSVKTAITIDESSSLYEGFPFPCTLTLEYRLYDHKVDVLYTVHNTGTDTLPFGFGLHPHFARLSGNEKTLITIPATQYMENLPGTMIPNGKLRDVAHTSEDVRTPTMVGTLNLDHVYTNIIPNQMATVDYTTLGFKVILHPTEEFTHIVIWTGHPKAVCIENQTCSTDAHNLYAAGFTKESHLLTLEGGATTSGTISYEIVQS